MSAVSALPASCSSSATKQVQGGQSLLGLPARQRACGQLEQEAVGERLLRPGECLGREASRVSR
jgi:hypothetical protein